MADGTWQPGERMPSIEYLATTYHEKETTVQRALYVLTIRGQLSQERLPTTFCLASALRDDLFPEVSPGPNYQSRFAKDPCPPKRRAGIRDAAAIVLVMA